MILLLLAMFAAAPTAALTLREVRIDGISDIERQNVRAFLSISRLDKKQRAALTEARLAFLLRKAPAEVQIALEPFGYYDPKVTVQSNETGSGNKRGTVVVLTIDPGKPVRVRNLDLAIAGDGGEDRYLQRDLERFTPAVDVVFVHPLYEESKSRLSRRLNERGYFDAELGDHRVEITRAQQAADITLNWTSGPRYAIGAARFSDAQIRQSLLDQIVHWTPGEPYHQGKLLKLQQRLTDLDYFASIDVQPALEERDSGQVPVDITLTQGKRSLYRAGVSYGTDSGGGITLGLDRRWVNDRGHKLSAALEYAQRREVLATQYRIPAFAWLEGWYTFEADLREETDAQALGFRRLSLSTQRSGRINDDWLLIAGLWLQREQTKFDGISGDRTTVLYPGLIAEYNRRDEPVYPRNALSARFELRGGPIRFLDQTFSFTQAQASALWVRGVGENNRLLVRAAIGAIETTAFEQLPASLRFYAGGDRSVRGYGYREIGPRFEGDIVTGAPYLLTAGIEFERMFSQSWGGAAFIDTGDAFAGREAFDLRRGVGVGVRWRSPIGPIGLDIAKGLDNPDRSWRLHFGIGVHL